MCPSAAEGSARPWSCGLIRGIIVLILLTMAGYGVNSQREDIKRLEVVAGGNITLTCYAQERHLRAYRWVYIRTGTKRPQVLSTGSWLVVGEPRFSLDTKAEDGTVILKLMLSDVRPYESGIFMCWRQGLRPDPQVLLTVLEPGTSSERQVIKQADGPSEVKYGDPATFTCIITPPWPVKVTWLKDGVEIPVTDRLYTQNVERHFHEQRYAEKEEQLIATLTVATIRKDTSFTCRIETDPTEERSMQVSVRVPRVVSLMAVPDQDAVEYGQSLSLTCIVSGSDSQVVWLKDGSELLFGANITGRQKHSSEQPPNLVSTVHIESMSFADNGHYVCYIPGASKDILINIEGRPARLLGVTGGNFFEDEVLTLSCTTQYARDTQQPTVSWQFRDEPLDPTLYESRTYRSDYNVTVHELTIPRAREHHAGSYRCVTPYGSAAISVDILVPPSLSEPLPSELWVKEGEELSVSCQTYGHPPPTVHWEKKIEDLWLPVLEVQDVVANDGVLTVPVVFMSTAGKYRCAAKSEAGSFFADVAVSVERAAPEVFDMIAPERVIVGDDFTVQCTIINWDEEVEFTFEGVSLNSNQESRYNVVTHQVEEGIMQAYLTVQEATLEDTGSYKCAAGPQASSSIFIEIEHPGEVIDLMVSPVIEGQDFFISCTTRNWLDEVRFYHNGKILSEDIDARYSIYTQEQDSEDVTNVLRVTSARPEDEGLYQCYLDAHTSHTIEVSLKSPEPEVLGVSATPAVVGHEFNVTCSIRNWYDQVTFTFNDAVVDPNKDWRYDVFVYPSSSDGQNKTHILRVSKATLEDSGLYECYTSPDTSASTSVMVWNEAAVLLELQSNDQPNWRDSPVPINCKVEGVDPNTVTVLFSHYDNPQVSIQNRTKMSTASHLVNIAIGQDDEATVPITTYTLGFYSLNLDLEGLWTCIVLSPMGATLGRDTMYLEIEEPPKFVIAPPDVVYEEDGADLYLNCSASGSPETMVAWYRKGIPEPIVFGQMSAMLFIPKFTNTDEGSYYCRAALHDREIQKNTTLKMKTPQPRVESVVASPAVVGGKFTVSCTVSNWRGEVLFTHNTKPADLEEGSRYNLSREQQDYGEWHANIHILTVSEATLQDSGVFECFLTPDIFGSANVIVKENDALPPTPLTIEEFNLPKPTLSPGRIVELRGPVMVEKGTMLLLTCLVSPVVQQEIVLIHDVFLLHVGDIKITEDPRIDIVADVSTDGSRLLYLRIKEVTESDGGEYQCATSTEPPAHSSLIVNVVSGIQMDSCELPKHWTGNWWTANEDYTISGNNFGKTSCISSSGNKFLMKEKSGCHICFIITEKHFNLLHLKGSSCTESEDLNTVCSQIENDDPVSIMARKNSFVTCPFTGSRSFTYQLQHDKCSEKPSKLTSLNNDTRLLFLYNPCLDQTTTNTQPYSELVDCVAEWNEDSTHFLLGKLEKPSDSQEQYHCYTYKEEMNEDHVYYMSQGGSEICENLEQNPNITYKVFDESKVPEPPVIEETEASRQVKVGDSLRLTCTSSGGFPPATIKWFRDNEELPSETEHVSQTSKAYLDIMVKESDDAAEYHCQTSNFATTVPLNTSIILTLLKDYENIMVPQVVAVEDDSVFLPCIQTSKSELKMDWYDADLDLHVTSGNETLIQEANYYPYIEDGLMGLMVISSFLDTTFSCTVEGQKLGNTTLIILPRYLLKEEFQDTQVFFEETETSLQVDEGGSITMECSLTENITSALVSWWRFSDFSLLTQGNINLAEAENYKLDVSLNSYQLTVTTANLTQAGLYICQAALNELEIYRKNFTLNVEVESLTTNLFIQDQEVKTPRPTESSEYEASGEDIGINKEVKNEDISEWEEEYFSVETTTYLITTTPPTIYEEEVLSCNGYNPSDITWKHNGDLIFLGPLNVAGIPGLSVLPNGDLILAMGPYREIRDDDTYVCYVEAYFDDVLVATYHVSLDGEDTIIKKTSNNSEDEILETTPESIPAPDFQFSGLKEEEVAVITNSKRTGNRILEVLQSGGLNTRLLEETGCRAPNETRNWSGAQEALEECEYQARDSEQLASEQSVFMGIDFFVEIQPLNWFAVTKLYVHNVKKNIQVNVFAPMVPVPISDIFYPPKADEPVILVSESWWDTVQGVDNSYGNALTASILSLQESYLNLLNGDTSP